MKLTDKLIINGLTIWIAIGLLVLAAAIIYVIAGAFVRAV